LRIPDKKDVSAPGICIVCKHDPMQDPENFLIDTGRTLDFDFRTRFSGTVYICRYCRQALVDVDDEFVKSADVVEEREAARRERNEATKLKDYFKEVAYQLQRRNT
jgi:hypothetical protein